jgi:hypothetical protein
MWVAAGADTASVNATLKYSYDGITWTNCSSGGFQITAGTGQYGWSLAWSGSMWVAGGTASNSFLNGVKYSGDGINWSNAASVEIISGSLGAWGGSYGVTWDGRFFLLTTATDSVNDRFKYSPNGINWYRTAPSPSVLNWIFWGIYPNGQGQYLATCWANNTGSNAYDLYTSTNPISTLTQATSGSTFPTTIVGYNGGPMWDGKKWILGVRNAAGVTNAAITLQ